MLYPNSHGKNSTNSQINPGTKDENKNSKVSTIKILLPLSAFLACKTLQLIQIFFGTWSKDAYTHLNMMLV